jgi:hypothetical protein
MQSNNPFGAHLGAKLPNKKKNNPMGQHLHGNPQSLSSGKGAAYRAPPKYQQMIKNQAVGGALPRTDATGSQIFNEAYPSGAQSGPSQSQSRSAAIANLVKHNLVKQQHNQS